METLKHVKKTMTAENQNKPEIENSGKRNVISNKKRNGKLIERRTSVKSRNNKIEELRHRQWRKPQTDKSTNLQITRK